MSKISYRRVDLKRVAGPRGAAAGEGARPVAGDSFLRWLLLILPLATLMCVVQAATVVLSENLKKIYISSTLVAVIGFVLLLVLVLVANPAIRLASLVLVRIIGRSIRPFSRVELITLFATIAVSSGVSTFGLTAQLVPLIPTPWNPEWNTPLRGWDQDLLPGLNPALYITDPEQVRLFRQGVAVPRPAESAPATEKITYYRAVLAAIPWSVWARPLAAWMIFVGACYGLFYCLAYVVLNYWSQREKLIFPLAQLPESLLPDADAPNRWWPRLFCAPGFWFGCLIAAAVLAWNACTSAGWIAGLERIPFGMSTSSVATLVKNTPFEGVTYAGGHGAKLQFAFGFFAIGIAFLLPLEVSFSIWFYFLVGQAIILVGSWMGYREFESDWLWYNNPVSGLGGGGLLLFSAMSLWRSVLEYLRLGAGQTLGRRIQLALPVLGLLLSIVVITAWLMWNRLPLFWALAFIGVTTLVTVGVMRIVAEGGIYWIQMHVSFFHIFKALGLGKFLSAALVGPLLPIYTVLFLDIKTFLAPNVLNAARMQQNVGGRRARFHVTVLIGLVVSVILSLGLAIFLSYMKGAQEMSEWFYSNGPQRAMDTARTAARAIPVFDGPTTGWYALGGIWVGLTMFLRQTLFWFPHPIGFIMQANPLIGPVWFSFFIGWFCKKVVVKYGGRATFDKVRVFFLGLIVGELLSVFIWPVASILGDFQIKPGIDLNRYGP